MKTMSWLSVVFFVVVALVLVPGQLVAQTGVLFVEGNKVGIGVAAPERLLHVRGTDGTTQLLVQEQSGTESARTMANLENNGVAYFRVTDTSADGSSWTFQAEGPSFRFNKAGSGGAEAILRSRNDAGGFATFTVIGSIEASNVSFTSARHLKTGFEQLDPLSVLAKVAALPVTKWTYKNEENGRFHIGPVAEDFNSAFGLKGSSATISMIDASGVAFAALQGLYGMVQQKEEAIQVLQAENDELRQRLERLEAAVDSLVSR